VGIHSPLMISRIAHLVRHGEVKNPLNVVYADLPGFDLSRTGRAQARATGVHLRGTEITQLITSPLDRAVQTAGYLAAGSDRRLELDARLTEWGLSDRWAGTGWPAIESTFAGEMTAYLEHPHNLDFVSESIEEVAIRVTEALNQACAVAIGGGDVVLVSHQDPIQACRLHATGRSLKELHSAKPGHASVVTLQQARGRHEWREIAYWEPEQAIHWPPVDGTDI
jgi:broad specificity phosphatase PhoE